MPLNQYPSEYVIVDGENHPVLFDFAYSVSAMPLDAAIKEIFDRHGKDICLLPLSGASAGAGVFQVDSKKPVIALHIQPAIEPSIRLESTVDIRSVGPDEIVIDKNGRRLYAGSAVNLNQLNLALADRVGPQYKVLGADLTSYTYAQVGATFMTGGMGPQRRYFSDSVSEIAIHDGSQMLRISGDDLKGFAGTYGWTGIVSAVCCNYVELPVNETAFALPVNNTPGDLARLLAHLSPFTRLQLDDGCRVYSQAGDSMILGLEHITTDAMQPFLDSGENELTKRTAELKLNCDAAEADGILFVSGFTDLDIDDFLITLVDDAKAEELTIAGISLEHTVIFKDPEQMRAVREGIPYAARMQSPQGKYSFKGHTDANIVLNPQDVESAMTKLWQLNRQYVDSVQQYFDESDQVKGEILVYGHLNPVGVDPHNRITFACDDENSYHLAMKSLDELKDEYILNLAKLCKDSGCDFVGGEKSAGSEYEFLPVFGDIDNAPPLLAEKANQQIESIKAASTLFSWRAMPPYQNLDTN